MAWLRALGVTPSSSAASLKLACGPAASKSRSAGRGGSVSAMVGERTDDQGTRTEDATLPPPLKIGVLGAGAIGCYVGGKLAAAGLDVVFLTRERIVREVEEHGLILRDLDGHSSRLPSGTVATGTDAAMLRDCTVVLVCVKCAATAEAGRTL